MASSGSFSGSICSGHYVLKVDWTQTQNVSDNTSAVACTLSLVNDWNLSVSSRTDNTCTIDGTSNTFSSSAISTTGTHSLATVSQTVSHAEDGSKTITITAVYNIRATISGTYYSTITATATITLDSIARASTISADAVDMGSTTTIAITTASSSFTHTLTYSFGSTSGTIATKTSSTSVSWTPPLTLADQIPSATSGTCTITCTTYNGSASIGSKTCTLTLTVPSTVLPTISSLTATRVDGDVPEDWGIYVKTKSKATLTISGASGSYGSTIKSYSISGGGYSSTASSFTTGFLNTSGTVTFRAYVTDSRGRTSAAATVSISVVAYSAPAFSSYSSQRCTSDGTVSDDGTSVRALCKYTYSSCSGNNTLTTSIQYKKSTDSTWTSLSEDFSSGTAVILGDGVFSTEYTYDIQYTLTDAFTSVSVVDSVSTASVLLDFKAGGTGLAVGKVAEEDIFDVGLPTKFRQAVEMEGDTTFSGAVYGITRTWYGTSSTVAATSIKIVACEGFQRLAGSVVTVYMTYANTASLPRLNINNTGSAYLAYCGTRMTSGSAYWQAGSMLTVMFTGTYYEVLSITGSWTPALSGTSSYTYREGYFTYHSGIVHLGFTLAGTFTSTTTTATVTTITGFPFTNTAAGIAAGGGIAHGCYAAATAFVCWGIASESSSIVGRCGSMTANDTFMAGSIYNYPSGSYSISGSITMKVI